MNIIPVLLVGVGGFIGASLRYIIGLKINFIFSTMIINVIGSFLIGLIMGYDSEKIIPINIKLLLVTGILGGFTTFSAFSYETINFINQGKLIIGIINVVTIIHIKPR